MNKCIQSLFFVALFSAAMLFTTKVYAQVPANAFGINAGFDSEWSQAGILYTLSNNMEVGVGLTFNNQSFTRDGGTAPDSKSTVGFNAYYAFYLAKSDVNPYIMVDLDYVGYPTSKSGNNETSMSDFGIGFAFGGQAFITKGLALYANIGLNYLMQNTTEKNGSIELKSGTNTLNLFTSAVGATFYF